MKILMMNSSLLREETRLVIREDLDFIRSNLDEMKRLTNSVEGIGLAANQVGIKLRFFLLKENEDLNLFINPEILKTDTPISFEEACLSIPGTWAETKRYQHLVLKFLDENFESQEKEYEGLLAAAIQHEVDHLDGKLYIDKLKPIKRSLVVNKHNKYIKSQGRA